LHFESVFDFPFSHFESVFDFQSRKQNRAVFFVYKNNKLHNKFLFFLWGETSWICVSKHRSSWLVCLECAKISKQLKGRIVKTRNVCRPGSEKNKGNNSESLSP
jgi:hypothetical protein